MTNKKNVWTVQEEQILFTSHAELGSKWATIAIRIPSKDQASIKNKFYSTLRKGFRKINSYITDIKRRSDPVRLRAFKTIQDIFISKLIAVVDGSHEEKYEVKPAALALAAGIEKMLLEIACSQNEYQQSQKHAYDLEERLLQKILEFNKNCKKRKGKRIPNDKRKVFKELQEQEQSQNSAESKLVQEENNKLQSFKKQESVLEKQQLKVQLSSFLSRMEKKESTSTIVNSFSDYAGQFIKYCEGGSTVTVPEEMNLIQSANIMTHSACFKEERTGWMYQSSSSRLSQPKMLSNYLTLPSPSPNDPFSPFSFSNIIKNNNITGSNMFEDKISCNQEEMGKSNAYQKEPLGTVPLVKVKTGEFLIQSADLQRQINQEAHNLSLSMSIDKQTPQNISQKDKLGPFFNNASNFSHQYAFQPGNSTYFADVTQQKQT